MYKNNYLSNYFELKYKYLHFILYIEMYFLIIGILIIGLLIIFYNPRQNIYENLNERSLKAYLGSINEDTRYEEGSSNSNGKSCLNNGEDG